MTENCGTWTGETPEAVAEAVSWLPGSVLRAQYLEDVEAAKQARAEKRARADRADEAHNKAVAAYMTGAAMRGEAVSAVDAANGNIGRTVAEVLSGATGELADRIPAHQRGERDYELLDAGEPVIRARYDDGWPSSSYEADSMLRRAEGLHGDLVRAQSRLASRQGRAAEHIAAERTKANHSHGTDLHRGGEITRYAPTPACDRCGHVRCECR